MTRVYVMSKAKSKKAGKVNITVRIDEDLCNEFRQFCRFHAGHPKFITQTKFIEAAVRAHMTRLREELNAPSKESGVNNE